MENEQNIAAIAHWVRQHRGHDATHYIAEQIGRLVRRGDEEAARLWRGVRAHFEELERIPAHA